MKILTTFVKILALTLVLGNSVARASTPLSPASSGSATNPNLTVAVAPFVGFTRLLPTGGAEPVDRLSTIGAEVDLSYQLLTNPTWTLAPLLTLGYDLGRGVSRDGANSIRVRHRNNIVKVGMQLSTSPPFLEALLPLHLIYGNVSYGLAQGVVNLSENSPTYHRLNKGQLRNGNTLSLSLGGQVALRSNVSIDLSLSGRQLHYEESDPKTSFEEERLAGFGLSSLDGTLDARSSSLAHEADSFTVTVRVGLAYRL